MFAISVNGTSAALEQVALTLQKQTSTTWTSPGPAEVLNSSE